jgi:hypothetical protein
MPHLPVHDVRHIGLLLDAAQMILMLAVTYILWCLVRMLREVQSVSRFYVRNWWSTYEMREEAAGDHQVPDASLNGPLLSTPVTREWGDGFSR